MKPWKLLATLTIAAAVLPLQAATYSHGQPGLWEATAQMSFAKGGLPPIPPEVLAQMKQMGRAPPDPTAPIVRKFCMTPQQAAEDKPPTPPQRGDCKLQNYQHSGNSFTADMVCSGQTQGSGHMSVSYDSDQHYAGTMHFAGTDPRAGTVDMTTKFSGRWLGANCGSVQPMPEQ